MASGDGGRKPLISGNWKMHHNHFEAIQTVQKLSYQLTTADYAAVDVSVHPPFTDLRSVQTVLESDEVPVALGAQHCHWEDKGAFTGEVSPSMLAKLNVSYVIAGHSERRDLFAETDEMVNRKVRAIIAAGMTPIMCVGEHLEEREAGTTEERVSSQVGAGLDGVSAEQVGAMVIAYEPIWAIGTGLTATPEDAQAVCGAIRAVVGEVAGSEAAATVRIQYGGSVKPTNTAELMAQPDIDGALVGGGSLDPDDFSRIVQYREG
ncbi:MAG: triose-phosphate isomerase [Actinomycetota bacterium]|jgi:triosephosphate isomerase|nr:triose-phosphate isomerase [Actinomycetota bacterium]MDQ3354550.1 triose-phosphate isomerase [Actinomycetota bacterium]